MRASLFSATCSRIVAALAALWLCSVGTAWAGDGGEDLGSLQSLLNGVCPLVGVAATSCPQLPTVTQIVLEIAGLENAPLEMVRSVGAAGPAINAGNPPAQSPPSLSNPLSTLSTLSPLAFISASDSQGQAKPTQLHDPVADNFFYAVTSGVSVQPDTLNLFYDDLSGTKNTFAKGQNVAAMSVPLAVLNKNGTERPVMTTLQIVASCTGGPACLTAIAIGDFSGNGNLQTRNAADLGINFAAVFGASAVQKQQPHMIFEVQIPLLVTQATDKPYFWDAINPRSKPYPLSPGLGTAFVSDNLGTKFSGAPIGIAPSAGPLCTAVTCPVPPVQPPPGVFPLCASLPNDVNGADAVPAVAAFYAIAVDGEALLQAPLTPTSKILCPF